MSNGAAPGGRETGKLLVLVMAILVLAFLVIAFWGSRHGTSANPAPVRNSQPAK